jgi:phage shock protein PspC (stress-responsive transcriptional regulator)
MVLIAGLAALWGVELPLVALGLILFGLALLYRQLVSA